MPIKTWQTGVLALLFIVAVVERVYGIDRQSLWSDELFAVTASYKPFFEGMWSRMISDSHPPGYILFMYVTLPLSGYSDFGIRFHALLFGIAWVPLVFMLARRWFSTPAALLAAALIASAYNAVYYSQEARAYTMFIAFNLWNVICFLEILFSDQQQRQYRTGFMVSMVAMLYLHYAGFVFFCAQGLLVVVLLMMGRSQANLKRWAFLFVVPMLVYAPWLGIMYNNLVHAPRDWSVSQVPTLIEVYNTLQRLL
ncbi:MAG: glycosyltransferase family 39 protein, partial [Pseudomonadales bacterium]|nr:glycosyltransferase family 39 protein [Pseudomonadales bacterium]